MCNPATERRRRARLVKSGLCVACRFPSKGYYYCYPCRKERAEISCYYRRMKKAKEAMK